MNSPDHPLARIFDLADDAIISVDAGHKIVLFNQGAEKIFGYHAKDIIGQPLDVLLPPGAVEIHRRHIANFASAPIVARRMGERNEIRGRRHDGSDFPAEASISKVQVDGQTMFTVILRDVTQRAIVDEKIKASLHEKEALLKEIHHRVKNNLQVVSSLLGLQSRSILDPEQRKMFEESQNRVYSMALLHESLYQSENLSRIDFPEYIRQLANHLFRSYGVAAERIRLRTELDPISLHMDVAVPCGLIINELVSNSLKYAFPDGRTGEIHIGLQGQPAGMAKLLVADDGIGLKNDIDWVTTRTLGLRLVRSLAQQVDGHLDVQSQPGTKVQLLFSVAA